MSCIVRDNQESGLQTRASTSELFVVVVSEGESRGVMCVVVVSEGESRGVMCVVVVSEGESEV